MKATNESLSNGGRNTLDISTITCNNRLCSEPWPFFQKPLVVMARIGLGGGGAEHKTTKKAKKRKRKREKEKDQKPWCEKINLSGCIYEEFYGNFSFFFSNQDVLPDFRIIRLVVRYFFFPFFPKTSLERHSCCWAVTSVAISDVKLRRKKMTLASTLQLKELQ